MTRRAVSTLGQGVRRSESIVSGVGGREVGSSSQTVKGNGRAARRCRPIYTCRPHHDRTTIPQTKAGVTRQGHLHTIYLSSKDTTDTFDVSTQEVTLDQGSRPDQLDRQSLSTFRGEVAPWLVREKQAAKIGPGSLRPESKREPLYIQSESRLRAMRIQKYDHSDGQARADVSAPPRARLNIRPAPFDPPLDVDLCRHYLPLLIALWHSSPLSASASVRLRFPRSGRVA